MEEARILLFFAALVVYALLAAERGVPSSAAPLTAVCGTTLWFVLFGCLGLLRPAACLYYALAVVALGWLVWRWAIKKIKPPKLAFGFWLFAGLSAVAIGILWARQPVFTTWDEFSFWGTAAKLTKLYDVFYTQAPVGWPWPATQMPAMIAFGYPAQVFGQTFLPWQTYAASDMLQFAAIAALCVPFEKKGLGLAFPTGVAAVLSPFLFTYYAAPVKVSAVYMDSLADVPLGLLFGAALALWFGLEDRRQQALAPLWLCLLVVTLTKDHVGIALALVVAAVMLCDALFGAPKGAVPLKKRLARGLAWFGGGVTAAAVAYLGWFAYKAVAVTSTGGTLEGTEETSLLALPSIFLRDLFGGGNASFGEVMRGMPALFLKSRITLLGSGAMVVAVILALLAGAVFFAGKTPLCRRCVVFAVSSTLGFLAYNFLIALSYIYIFRDDQLFASYERYMYPYYIGWFLAALVLLGTAVRDAKRRPRLGRAAVLALGLLVFVRVAQVVPVNYTILGFDAAEFANQRGFGARVQHVAGVLADDDLVFIVSSGDDGSRWFRFCYEFLPLQVDYSFGGGDFTAELDAADGATPAARWAAYLQGKGITAVYIDDADGAFIREYGALFSDGLRGYEENGTGLYRVEPGQSGLLLAPLEVEP